MVLCAAILLTIVPGCDRKNVNFVNTLAHWPDLKNLFQLFANFHHQSVHRAPGATLNHTLRK